MDDIKIWVSYYKDEQVSEYGLHSDDTHILYPVHHDAEGKSINHMHPVFSEIVMMWHIWQNNLKSNYIGFSQYRRTLVPGRLPKKGECQVYQIANFADKTVYDQYAQCHSSKDLDLMLSCIDERHGADNPYSKHIRESHIFYARCMFLMKWADFVKLCKFIFPLIEDYASRLGLPMDQLDPWIEKAQRDFPNKRTEYNVRCVGFLAERLISAWISANMAPYLNERSVAIVNYNTTMLTEAAIKSLLKHTPYCHVYVFDNSDKEPFKTKIPNVDVIDNTKGKVVDFEQELAKYPNKHDKDLKKSNYGSAKHAMSVDKLMEMVPDGFVLMDSDVLIKEDISSLWDRQTACIGTEDVKHNVPLLVPFLCWINVSFLKEHHIGYYNGDKMWALSDKEPDCWYDTGAWLLEEVRRKNLPVKYIDIWKYVLHLGHGSWRGEKKRVDGFLNENANLWK